jgi:hypothetical protein
MVVKETVCENANCTELLQERLVNVVCCGNGSEHSGFI